MQGLIGEFLMKWCLEFAIFEAIVKVLKWSIDKLDIDEFKSRDIYDKDYFIWNFFVEFFLNYLVSIKNLQLPNIY